MAKTRHEVLVDEAWENEQMFTKMRGYSSGITKEMLDDFDDNTLERVNKEVKQSFKEWGWT